MINKFIFFLGLVVFITSLLVYKTLKNNEQKAIARNDQKTSYGIISSDIPPCSWNATAPEKIMTENTTQAITVHVSSSKDLECESVISLTAPGFDMSPSKEIQTINLSKDKKGSLSWILSPRKTGTFDISISDMINTRIFGVSVTNMFGLSPVAAKSLSFMGTLLGPMLTVPWWWDRLKKRKDNLGNTKAN